MFDEQFCKIYHIDGAYLQIYNITSNHSNLLEMMTSPHMRLYFYVHSLESSIELFLNTSMSIKDLI